MHTTPATSTRTHLSSKQTFQSLDQSAQEAEVEAYWIGCSCLGDLGKNPERVWTSCDIVCGCFQVVIAVPSRPGKIRQGPLEQWGDRIWTLSEMLLSPGADQISIYSRPPESDEERKDLEIEPGQHFNRRESPRILEDAPVVGQLVDYLEGSVVMTLLELTITVFKSLQQRDTTEFLKGDRSYALTGFLRQKPHVCSTDSEFQAFARLSLANDSNAAYRALVFYG